MPFLGPYDTTATDDYREQARDFLSKSRQYLAAGDLHQASDKGWGAAAWMAKAVAVARSWEYERHEQFNVVLNNARVLTGNLRVSELRGIANDLRGNFYVRKRFLNPEEIGLILDNVAELLDILEPLTTPSA